MNSLFKKIAVASTFLFALNSHAALISEVGGVDKFIASSDLMNSGDAIEQSWVESVLGQSVFMGAKVEYDDNAEKDWTLVENETDVFFSNIDSSFTHFMLKLGTNGTELVSHYLFENIGDLNFAVVDFSDADVDFSIRQINIGRLSHTSSIQSTASVPEPIGIAIFAVALIGLSLRQLKK